MSLSIVVVGSVNMDLVVRTPRLPAPGETLLGFDFSTAPGGKGANQAVAAARLGAAPVFVGRVGADQFGSTLRAGLDAAGCDTRYLIADPTAASGIAAIAVDDGGQNTIIVAPGANARVSPADVDAARPAARQARALLAQLEIPLETVAYALGLARAAGQLTVLNPAPAQPLPSALLRLVDLLVPNEVEAGLLTGLPIGDWASAEAAAHALFGQGAQAGVITLGARGALFWDGEATQRVLPLRVQAVDATAAGDAFVAALGVAWAGGASPQAALREASAAGALATTRHGAQPSLPTRAEVDTFLRAAQ